MAVEHKEPVRAPRAGGVCAVSAGRGCRSDRSLELLSAHSCMHFLMNRLRALPHSPLENAFWEHFCCLLLALAVPIIDPDELPMGWVLDQE